MTNVIEQIAAIVPAAGIGSRMGAEIPKQYLMLNGQPILGHTLDILLTHPRIERVIVALSPDDTYFEALAQSKHPKLERVIGGNERADSVLAGLSLVTGGWALVHDAARPCLTSGDINKLITAAEQAPLVNDVPQGAILAMPVRDTMKRGNADGQIMATVCREALWHALTPQLFPTLQLRDNLTNALAAGATITDEASAMEWAGMAPALVAGRGDNIKVTHPDDLRLAALFLNNNLNHSD
ncbi:2-C-methyl-D-erythritol 4-phosphate cytidylyltransferase [Shewanella colwelliana]|uniref:2-C-methyl-D-erythritol 4-phosphate cytidylyltransferase n=1 Tax=Shewanella colwelliana TaxID=23 RepID=UPI0022B066EE|nr:2-C-methyl-D-erythritol 4-phosphate cytidylyltransferase [Shewanella colwelliana]MCZ4338599.1 2-C-methyl-D-erythritol 4-phosphate cytidylyltransferase [Shewanella colwelliana]